MKLNELQQRLELTYDVSTPHRVEDFVFHDVKLVRAITRGAGTPCSPEKLLVSEQTGCVNVSLFLDRGILGRLSADNPNDSLHSGNLQDFCLALEGVSHFLYLIWNVGFERPVTQLELELQAEVDKFITAAALIGRQYGARGLLPLRRLLFERVVYHSDLEPEQRRLYEEANRLAARYCSSLERRFCLREPAADLRRELRLFYRMNQGSKLRHIQKTNINSR